ncbi:MAG: DUF6115 domain-containing protein [Bacillota bacterium]
MGLFWLLMVMAVILMATAVYSVQNRRKVADEFTADMKSLIQEAVLVKKDLESVMENTLMITDDMIKNLDERLNELEKLVSSQDHRAPDKKPYRTVERRSKKPLPFAVEDLRRAHPSIVVPRLWNAGYSISEIAELLDRGQGEVRLILDIQKRREISS